MPKGSANADDYVAEFIGRVPSPLRYDVEVDEPHEVAALLGELVPEGARVLDVGCGTGVTSAGIRRRRGVEVVGVEPNEQRVERARARGLRVVHGLLTEEVVRDLGSFDVVLFADVLEHLADPGPLLKLACSALRPHGSVLISVPNVAHWSVRRDLLLGRFDYDECGIMDATHLRWFTQRSLVAWLQANGLRVDMITQSAGTKLAVYERDRPWRWLREDLRSGLVSRLANRWPHLFGCQYIVRASPLHGVTTPG